MSFTLTNELGTVNPLGIVNIYVKDPLLKIDLPEMIFAKNRGT
jgi:hypothetical protein